MSVLFSCFILLIVVSCSVSSSSPVSSPVTIPEIGTKTVPANPTPQPSGAATNTFDFLTPAASSSTVQAPGVDSPDAFLDIKQAGSFWIELRTVPNPPISGNNTFTAFVTAAGQAVSDVKVSFDFDMTNMSMGKYVVTPSLSGEGVYTGKVFLSMPGPWRVVVSIERAAQTSDARFDFLVN
jgi:hypothetical protein